MATLLFWSRFEQETPETQNSSKVQVDCGEAERKTRSKNSRGKKRKVEQENNQLQNELNANRNPVSEPLQKEAQKKVFLELQNEKIATPDTPRDAKEKGGMIQELSSSTKKVDTLVSKFRGRNGRQRTRPKNKLRTNMKVVLDSEFQKDAVTIVEDSLSDKDPQVAYIEHHTMDQSIEHHIMDKTPEEIEK